MWNTLEASQRLFVFYLTITAKTSIQTFFSNLYPCLLSWTVSCNFEETLSLCVCQPSDTSSGWKVCTGLALRCYTLEAVLWFCSFENSRDITCDVRLIVSNLQQNSSTYLSKTKWKYLIEKSTLSNGSISAYRKSGFTQSSRSMLLRWGLHSA